MRYRFVINTAAGRVWLDSMVELIASSQVGRMRSRSIPHDAEMLGELASILAEFNLDLDRVVELSERAAKLAPAEDSHPLTPAEA